MGGSLELLIGKWFIQLSMRTGCIVFKTTGEEFPLFITISWVIYHHHNPASPFLFINITIVFVPSSFGGVLTMCQVLYMKRNCLLHLINLVNGEGNGTLLQYSCLENPMDGGSWWAAVYGVAQSRTRLSNFTFTFHFQALEKDMATHSSVLAWRIPGTGEPGGLLSMGLHRVGHHLSDLAAAAI